MTKSVGAQTGRPMVEHADLMAAHKAILLRWQAQEIPADQACREMDLILKASELRHIDARLPASQNKYAVLQIEKDDPDSPELELEPEPLRLCNCLEDVRFQMDKTVLALAKGEIGENEAKLLMDFLRIYASTYRTSGYDEASEIENNEPKKTIDEVLVDSLQALKTTYATTVKELGHAKKQINMLMFSHPREFDTVLEKEWQQKLKTNDFWIDATLTPVASSQSDRLKPMESSRNPRHR